MKDTQYRREFLGGLMASTGLLALSGMPWQEQLAYAMDNKDTEYKDRYFVFLFMPGGWDVLLTLDPRDPAVFTKDKEALTLIDHGYQFQAFPGGQPPIVDTAIGPLGTFMGDALKHANKLAVIRGISMETLGHISGTQRLITGKAPVGTRYRGSSFDVWAASLLGKNNPLPNIAVSHPSVNLDQPGYASPLRVFNSTDLASALARNTPYSDNQEAAMKALLLNAQQCPNASQSPIKTQATGANQSINKVIELQLAESFKFNAQTDEIKALKAHYQTNGQWGFAARRTAMASQALKKGLSRVVTANIGNGLLDTHGSMDTNGPDQMVGFDAFARLIEDLETSQYKDTSESWLDRTTIMLSSEFTRTPLVNQLGGRDHWLMNCVVLAGGDVKGGTVVGASSDIGMMPMPVNLATGKVDLENGEIIKPEHIYRTLMKGIGVSGDPADYRVDPIDALLKSG